MPSARKEVRVSLAPPEITYFNEIKHSVGVDPLVSVGPLRQVSGSGFSVTLTVKGLRKAKALATLLILNKTLDNLRIRVRVRTSEGQSVSPITGSLTPLQLAKLYRTAFRSNKLFCFVSTRAIFAKIYVYPVFKLRIVQFPNDDLSDFYLNYNNVAAFVFRDVLRNSISRTSIQFSTALKRRGSGA